MTAMVHYAHSPDILAKLVEMAKTPDESIRAIGEQPEQGEPQHHAEDATEDFPEALGVE